MLEGIHLQRIVLCELTGFYVFLKDRLLLLYCHTVVYLISVK